MTTAAFVLAAGFGTRLQPLTHHRPKPLVPVCGVPMLSYSLALLCQHGFERALVNAHHLAEQVLAWQGTHEGVVVTVVHETPDILGTGGGLRAVRHQLDERFVVVNADVLHDVDLGALRDAVPDGGGALALRPHAEDAARYGYVTADATGTIVQLAAVATAEPEGAVAGDTHFTGIHAMHRDALERVPDGFACIVRTAYRALVPERRVQGLRHRGTWLDVGDPRAYLQANLAVLKDPTVSLPLDPFARAAFATGRRGTHGAPPEGVTVHGAAWVGQDVTFGEGVSLTDSIVGEGATVSSHATLTRCVVWDGCTVPPGEHRDTLVHDGGVLTMSPP